MKFLNNINCFNRIYLLCKKQILNKFHEKIALSKIYPITSIPI